MHWNIRCDDFDIIKWYICRSFSQERRISYNLMAGFTLEKKPKKWISDRVEMTADSGEYSGLELILDLAGNRIGNLQFQMAIFSPT